MIEAVDEFGSLIAIGDVLAMDSFPSSLFGARLLMSSGEPRVGPGV